MFRFSLILTLLYIAFNYQCQGVPNPSPIVDGVPILVKSVPHGKKFIIDNKGQKMYLVNLTGNAWEMGFAYGTLLKQEIQGTINGYFRYVYQNAEQQVKVITKLPKFIQPLARATALAILRSILKINVIVTRPYTPVRYIQQMTAIAAGSGMDLSAIEQINMYPEYSKAGCSIFGAWGKATKDGHLLQLRALDWDTHSPIQKYPVIAIYHSTEKGSYPFANIGWGGFIGSITGFSEHIGMSEKFRGQKTNENETRIGKPWNYAVRDTLQFSKTIDEALEGLGRTDRTCSIYLGIGSKVNNTFRLVEYSYKEFTVYDDVNFPYTDVHLQFDDVVMMPLHDKSPCFSNLVQQNYGQITAEWIATQMAPLHESGTTQLAVFDFQTLTLWLQYCRDGKMAFERQAVRIELSPFLKK